MYSFFSSLGPASCYLSSILLLPTQCYSKYSLSSMTLLPIDCTLRVYLTNPVEYRHGKGVDLYALDAISGAIFRTPTDPCRPDPPPYGAACRHGMARVERVSHGHLAHLYARHRWNAH